MRRRLAAVHGQATVELVALIPLVVLVGAAAFHVLAAGTASEAAGSAAEAGAIAALQGRDAGAAARGVLDGWPARSTSIAVDGGRIRVTVRPRIPVAALAARLATTVEADAGPRAHPAPSAPPRGGDGAG